MCSHHCLCNQANGGLHRVEPRHLPAPSSSSAYVPSLRSEILHPRPTLTPKSAFALNSPLRRGDMENLHIRRLRQPRGSLPFDHTVGRHALERVRAGTNERGGPPASVGVSFVSVTRRALSSFGRCAIRQSPATRSGSHFALGMDVLGRDREVLHVAVVVQDDERRVLFVVVLVHVPRVVHVRVRRREAHRHLNAFLEGSATASSPLRSGGNTSAGHRVTAAERELGHRRFDLHDRERRDEFHPERRGSLRAGVGQGDRSEVRRGARRARCA